MTSVARRLRTLVRPLGRHARVVLLGLVVALVAAEALGGHVAGSPVAFVLAVSASFATGARERGVRLALTLGGATAGLAAANQLDPATTYSPLNDLVFFGVVVVGAPALAGGVVAGRAVVLRRVADRARRSTAEVVAAEDAAAAEERARLERELDDFLAHRVGEIVLQAAGAERVAAADPDRALQALERIEDAGRAVLSDLREVLGVLRVGDEDVALAPAPSLEQIGDLGRRGEVAVRVEGSRGALDPGVDATAYRVVQAALEAASAPASVLVCYGRRAVEIEVAGGALRGEDGEAIRRRVALFGGRCNAAPDQVVAQIPRRPAR